MADLSPNLIWKAVALYVTCCLTAIAGMIISREAGGIAVFWLPNAIMLAVLLRAQTPSWPVFLAAGLAGIASANFIFGDRVAVAAILASANGAEVIFAASIARVFFGNHEDFERPKNLLLIGAIAAVCGPSLGATCGALTVAYFYGVDALEIWPLWYLSDAFGILMFTPFLLFLHLPESVSRRTALHWVEGAIYLITAGVVALAVFMQGEFAGLFLLFPFSLLCAVRLGLSGAASAAVVISLIATVATVEGQGPIAQSVASSEEARILALQFLLVVLIVSTLPIGALLTTKQRLETELRHAREEAERANLAKSEFLTSMSHELRTPLNAILGFTQLLHDDRRQPLNSEQREFVEHIERSGKHLLNLIGDVLDLARIESGQTDFSIEAVRVGDVLIELSQAMKPLALTKEVELSVGLPTDRNLAVRADYARLLQVLLNLASNAVKYNRQGGSVSVNVTCQEPGWLRITVSDTGFGIPRNRHDQVFQPFNRLGAEQSQIEGTGIGLSIAKNLVERMGGRIGFDSQLDAGSTFWIDLAEEREQPAAAPQTSRSVKDSPASTRQGASGATVLYIEDNPSNLTLMSRVIDRLDGARMLAAPTGEQGVSLAAAHRPDVIFVDIHLPGIDGFEVLRRLKANPHTANIPTYALSAAAMRSDIQRGKDAGFDDYLTKPIVVSKILDVVQKVTAQPKAA